MKLERNGFEGIESRGEGKEKKRAKRFKGYRLRMTDKEAARLERLSEETGMSKADVMRDALEKYRG